MSKENDLLPNGARMMGAAQVIVETLQQVVSPEDLVAARAEIKEIADEIDADQVIVALAALKGHVNDLAEFTAARKRNRDALRKVRRGRH